MRNVIEWLLDLLYPPRCVFCRRLLREGEKGLCRACREGLPSLTPVETRREVPGTVFCSAPFLYEGAVREALLRYKFHGAAAYGRTFAEFIAKCVDENAVSCDSITWVPLSRRRLRQRGYDQARILAEETAKLLGLPCEKMLVKRVDNRPQSSTRSAEERRQNARDVYACKMDLTGRRVLLIDDIVTTGATLSECAGVLKKAGCAAVYAAAAASRQ